MGKKNNVFNKIKGGLIVSCQALPGEPLFGSHIMAKMAYAAKLGGASGIRANSCEDIKAIRQTVDLPIIGIIKEVYPDSDVYITPTMREISALAGCGVDIIAIDATDRIRPFGETLSGLFEKVKKEFPNMIFMADCSNYEEAKFAEEIGFDCVGTTLCGYTEYTKHISIPDMNLIKRIATNLKVPVIAEGGIWTVEQLQAVYEAGAFSAVIGTAITRPMEITRYFVSSIKN